MKPRQDDPGAVCLGVSADIACVSVLETKNKIHSQELCISKKRNLGMTVAIWIIYLYDTIAHGCQYRKRLCGMKCFGGWSYFSQPWGRGGLSIHRHARCFHQCLSPLLGQHLIFWAGWFCIILLFSVEMICLILNFIALKNLYVIDAPRLN